MYRPRGFAPAELGDVEVIEHLGELHLFHLTLPSHDRVAHVVSTDGLAWKPLPDALTTGPPGAFDDDMIWTVSVTPHEGVFVMLYTALATADEGRVQRVGLATSDDLIHWRKGDGGPVSEADSRWYVASQRGEPWVSWRDPKPLFHDGTYYLAVCARQTGAPFLRRGAVALLTSEDMHTWRCGAPLFAPTRFFELECPQIFTLGGVFYLTAITQDDHCQRYWVADDILGPYETPPNNRLVPDGHSAVRVCETRHGPTAFCWHRSPLAPTRRTDTRAVVPSPLVLRQDDGRRLACQIWPGLSDYDSNTATALDGDALVPTASNRSAVQHGGVYSVQEGMEIWSDGGHHRHIRLRAEFSLSGSVGGVVLGLDDETGGLYVELDRGEKRIRLIQVGRDVGDGRPWFRRKVLQEAVLGPTRGGVDLEVVYVDGELIVSLDARVLLAAVTEARQGAVGVFAVSGRLDVETFEIQPMRSPLA